MIEPPITKAVIPLKQNKDFIPFVVDFKAEIKNQGNKIKKITIKIKYNFRTSEILPLQESKIKGAIIAPF